MKTMSLRVGLLIVVCVVLCSCAGQNSTTSGEMKPGQKNVVSMALPSHALTEPADGVSILHPVEHEKGGVKAVTIIHLIMNPDLWVEMISNVGVFPIVGYKKDKYFLGYAYWLTVSYQGDAILQATFPNGKEEMEGAQFLIFNRDAGYAYTLDGRSVEYSPDKYEDSEYREKLFSTNGQTLEVLSNFWEKYTGEYGSDWIKSIVVGSKEWMEYRAEIVRQMPENYKMADGSIRIGQLPMEAFQMVSTDMTRMGSGEQFLKGFKFSLTALPFLATNIAGHALEAFVNTSWNGYFARARVIRHDLAPQFHFLVALYKKMIQERNEEIERLRFKLSLRQ